MSVISLSGRRYAANLRWLKRIGRRATARTARWLQRHWFVHHGQVTGFAARDPRGELWCVAARRRREMGRRVLLLDPFGVVAKHKEDFEKCHLPDVRSATYNPLAFNPFVLRKQRMSERADGTEWSRRALPFLTGGPN